MRNTCVIRWKKDIKSWINRPNMSIYQDEVDRDPALWDLYVHEAPAFLTANINTGERLVNGSRIEL